MEIKVLEFIALEKFWPERELLDGPWFQESLSVFGERRLGRTGL